MKVYLFILSLFFCSITFAQNSISGFVNDANNMPVSGANVTVVGESKGTVTDSDGKFILNSNKKFPFSIEISNVGFASQKIIITSNNQKVNVKLLEEQTNLEEIVVSASRTAEKVKESPVTVERMTIRDIKKTASPSFYDGLENLKEVQMNTSSLSFKSINTRGFATVSNTRFMQLVDGMDNSSPLLNFVLGNLIGISEIDVQSVELLPGASSALYGANAFNGILFMNSKSPFTSPGVTSYVKYGQTSQNAAGVNNFYDYGIRVAGVFSKHFAAKANFTFMNGTDWFATNYDGYQNGKLTSETRATPGYDGLNVYGDEVATNIKDVAKAMRDKGVITPSQWSVFDAILPNQTVSRTGYNETDLTDNKASNAKVDFSLHFKPFDNDFEIIWQSKFGFGNAVYQGKNRYYLNNFFMEQHKIELKGKNFFVRGYTTTEDGGKSYDMLFTGINIAEIWKPRATWFGQYAATYVNSTLQGATPDQAHLAARNVADTGRFLPGTPEFMAAFNKVTSDPDVLTGSKLVDNSRIWHSDANYNFKDAVKFAEIQVGGSYRIYDLNSHGRIYTDKDGTIKYNEFGIYTQIQKKLMDDRLKLTGSIRYDKAKNFEGNYSPRISAVYSVGDKKQHTFRGSFQTGFRNPTTQDQYIGFNVGNAVLIGSAPDNLIKYSETRDISAGTPAVGQIYASGNPLAPLSTRVLTGEDAYFNSYTAASVTDFADFATKNPGNTPGAASKLVKSNASFVKPETVKSIDLGYRGTFEGFNFDINGYLNIYNNFIGNLTVLTPLYGKASNSFDFVQGATDAVPYLSNPAVQSLHALANGNYRAYQLYTNTDIEIKSMGFGVGLSKKVIGNFELGANYNYSNFDFDQAKDPSFEASFNTPKHRVKASIGNDKLFKNFGFNLSGRWNSAYLWESTMADGMIAEATVLDAQINYNLPKLKSTFKFGAANLGGKEYYQVLGAGSIGRQIFASWTINP